MMGMQGMASINLDSTPSPAQTQSTNQVGEEAFQPHPNS